MKSGVRQDFRQVEWDQELEDDCRQVVRLGIREDLARSYDLTTVALVPRDQQGSASVMAREPGIIAGLPAVAVLLDELNVPLRWHPRLSDGARVESGMRVAQLDGPARDLLTAERLLLNLLGRLSGVATLTRRFADAVARFPVRLYDTRKTTPGWRRLEKYAVRCGGGHNHRTGLFDAVLIKDNHLAQASPGGPPIDPAEAVRRARQFLQQALPDGPLPILEIEVDTLSQLKAVLPEQPDLVLLDNMTPEQLRCAVDCRDGAGVLVELEASGGIALESIAEVAATGVDRISIGALTHSATALDLALDWEAARG